MDFCTNAATNILTPHIPTLFAVLYIQGEKKKRHSDRAVAW